MKNKHEKYERLIELCKSLPPTPTAVAHPCDQSSLQAVVDAARAGLIAPILVGPRARIEAVAKEHSIDIGKLEIMDAPHSEAPAAALGGLDALVFTGGIGEHAVAIRERVCRDAVWVGVELDTVANGKSGPRISTAASRVAAWVIPTNEELMIARHTRALLAADARRLRS